MSKEGKEKVKYEMDVGERGEWEELEREENGKNWERIEKHRKDRKIGNSDFIDSVGYNL